MRIRQFGQYAGAICFSGMISMAMASPPPVVTDDPNDSHDALAAPQIRLDMHEAMIMHDAAVNDLVSDGPSANVTKNLAPASHGVRLEADATTDVWALGKYAYTGTFNDP